MTFGTKSLGMCVFFLYFFFGRCVCVVLQELQADLEMSVITWSRWEVLAHLDQVIRLLYIVPSDLWHFDCCQSVDSREQTLPCCPAD